MPSIEAFKICRRPLNRSSDLLAVCWVISVNGTRIPWGAQNLAIPTLKPSKTCVGCWTRYCYRPLLQSLLQRKFTLTFLRQAARDLRCRAGTGLLCEGFFGAYSLTAGESIADEESLVLRTGRYCRAGLGPTLRTATHIPGPGRYLCQGWHYRWWPGYIRAAFLRNRSSCCCVRK